MRALSVLVIDDEPLVGAAIERLLRHQHNVRVVSSARQALLVCLDAEPFDVILCDLMMPEMTGAEFFREAVQTDPSLSRRIVFMTGGAFTPEAQQFLDQAASPILDKPFNRQSVLAALERCMDSQSTSERPLAQVQLLSEG